MQAILNLYNKGLVNFNARNEKFQGIMIYLTGCFIVCVIAVISRFLGSNLHVVNILFYRGIVLFAVLYFTFKKKYNLPMKINNNIAMSFFGAFAFLGLCSWFYCLQIIPMGEATALMFASPILAVCLAIIFLKEKLYYHRILAIIIGIIGSYIIVDTDFESFKMKYIWVFLAAFFAALFATFGRFVNTRNDPRVVCVHLAFYKTALAIPFLFYFGQIPTLKEFMLLILLGLISAPGQMCNMVAFSKVELSMLLPFDFSTFIFASIFGVIFFGESIYLNTVVGAIVILLGAYIIIKKEKVND